MSATAKNKQYDEELINFFDESLVGHADNIYRMAFALTLSLDGASQLCSRTFQQAAKELEKFHAAGDTGVLPLLVGCLWKCFQELGNARFQEGSSAVTKTLKEVAVEARAALMAVDIAGIAPLEASKLLGWSETDLRRRLAAGRRAVMSSSLT